MKNNQYRASIKVVGTVLPETKLILNKYLELKDLELLKKEVLDNNLILKTSKRRAETIYYEIRKRYFKNQIKGYNEDSFIYLIKNINTDSIVDLILYYHLCKEEKIVFEYITNVIYHKYEKGYLGFTATDTIEYIQGLSKIDENVAKWSDRTMNDVRSAMEGILKDFGFINSRKKPTFNRVFIPSIVFYYVIYQNIDSIETREDLYNCQDLKLFLLLKNDIDILIEESKRNDVFYVKEETNTIVYKYKNIREIIDDYVKGQIC